MLQNTIRLMLHKIGRESHARVTTWREDRAPFAVTKFKAPQNRSFIMFIKRITSHSELYTFAQLPIWQ